MKMPSTTLILLLAAGAACAWLRLDTEADHDLPAPWSAQRRDDQGLSQAAAWLRARGHTVTSRRSAIDLEQHPTGAVLLRLAPQPDPLADHAEDAEAAAPDAAPSPLISAPERAWISQGNRLVIAPLANGRRLELVHTRAPLHAALPRAAPLTALSGITQAFAALPAGCLSLLLAEGQPVLAQQTIGAGDLILLADPRPLRNDHFAEAANLALLAWLCTGHDTVLVDAVAQGRGLALGPTDLLVHWGFGPALVAGLLALGLLLWRHLRPLGPCDPPPARHHREAIDLVDSLAELYRQHLSPPHLLIRYHASLVATCARRLHRHGPDGDRTVARLLDGQPPPRPSMPAAQLLPTLRALNRAHRRLDDEQSAHHR